LVEKQEKDSTNTSQLLAYINYIKVYVYINLYKVVERRSYYRVAFSLYIIIFYCYKVRILCIINKGFNFVLIEGGYDENC